MLSTVWANCFLLEGDGLAMKRVMVLWDGAADEPQEALGNKTPLEAADIVQLHKLAKEGTLGWTRTILEGLPVQPEVAAMETFGYDSQLFYTGRGAFRALGADVPLGLRDVAFTLAFLATDGEKITETEVELSHDELRALMEILQEKLGDNRFRFVPLKAQRHVLLWHEGFSQLQCEPPDELKGEPIAQHLPKGDNEGIIQQLIYDALELLERHEINRKRIDEGKPPANLIWLYEPGVMPKLPSLRLVAGMIRADAVTDHIPMRGLCIAAGIRPHRPPTVDIDNLSEGYDRLASFVNDLIPDTDLLIVHIREADKASHRRDPELKVFALQRFAEIFLPRLLDAIQAYDDARLLLICTHKSNSATGKHVQGEVPFLFLPRRGASKADEFHEEAAKTVGVKVDRACELARWLLDIQTPISVC
jgi:2,3-bisphosphoglycerate-independent phosphoglycerate mutase